MTFAPTQPDIRGVAQLHRSAIWGPAAGAQIQTSPGASALAAPLQHFHEPQTRKAGGPGKWLGVVEAAISVSGVAGIIGGLYMLATSPLPAVISILASMTLLVGASSKMAQLQEARCAHSRLKTGQR